jgi:hypothetical protein
MSTTMPPEASGSRPIPPPESRSSRADRLSWPSRSPSRHLETGAEFEQLQYSQQTDIRFLLRLLGTESGIHYPCQPEQEIIAGRRSGQEPCLQRTR